MKIYLSPANHTKPYATGHNEKQQMELVAKEVQRILSDYDCTVYYPTVFYNAGISGSYLGRPQEAKKLGCDVYVSIHSNASGKANSTVAGCCAFYHPTNSTSKKLAEAFQQKLDSVCPIASTLHSSMKVINGMEWNGSSLGEIREPYLLGVTSVLIETNFHDYEPTAKWIVANISNIAKAIADVLISFYSIKKRAVTMPKDTMSADNLAKLVSAKVITTPDYWTSLSLQYLNELCSNAIPWVDNRVTNGIKDFATALQVLNEAGIINTPAYWIEQSKKVKYIDQLIVNMANRSRSVLEKIVYAEAGIEDEKGQILVANVIMNRVKNKSFPNSIYDVIVQTNQFEPVRRGTFASAVPTAKVKAAVDKALNGVDYSQGALYFRAIKGAEGSWHDGNLTELYRWGGHIFYV